MHNQHCFVFRVKDGQILYGRIYADTARRRVSFRAPGECMHQDIDVEAVSFNAGIRENISAMKSMNTIARVGSNLLAT